MQPMDLNTLRILNAGTLQAMQNLHTKEWFPKLDVEQAQATGKYQGELFFVGGEDMRGDMVAAAWTNGHLPNSEATRKILRTKLSWASRDPEKPSSLHHHDPGNGIHPGMVLWNISGRVAGVSGWKGLVDHIKACKLGVFAGHMSQEAANRLLDPSTFPQLMNLITDEGISITGANGYWEMVKYIEQAIIFASQALED